MFHAATLRLTGWYLLILMSTSILFSLAIYNVATVEVRDKLDAIQTRYDERGWGILDSPGQRLMDAFRERQDRAAMNNIALSLFYVNILVLIGGGTLSYMLARRTLRQIELAHEAQSRFASDASHELRTPLTAIKSELEVALRDKKLSKSDMQEVMKSNLEEVNKLTTLSDMLLTLSRMNHADISFQAVNLGNITAEVVQKYDKNLNRVKFQQPKSPILVRANPTSLEELVTILVDNALKYSPEKSKIDIKLSVKGKKALFEITNRGKGIPTEKLPFIFDRFYRADESRTEGGSGLGLSLAKEIVAIHKGELTVTSAINANTTFTVTLPVAHKEK